MLLQNVLSKALEASLVAAAKWNRLIRTILLLEKSVKIQSLVVRVSVSATNPSRFRHAEHSGSLILCLTTATTVQVLVLAHAATR